jgi:hypothetical protein
MDGGGGTQHPFCRVNEPKKTGARSARARMRGQNPLVPNKSSQYSTLVCCLLQYLEIGKKFFIVPPSPTLLLTISKFIQITKQFTKGLFVGQKNSTLQENFGKILGILKTWGNLF